MTTPDPHDRQRRDGEERPAQTTAIFDRISGSESTDGAAAAPQDDDRAVIEALPASSALLIVQHGPNAGARFLLDSERTTAGRHPKADIFLDDVTVSRKHAEFLLTDVGHLVRDIGSLNGTYVNRTRIEQAHLGAGDEVQIGKFRLTYHPSPNRSVNSEAAAAESPAPDTQSQDEPAQDNGRS